MEATISMESLWQMIQTLSPSNKHWLSEKLLEEDTFEKTTDDEYISKKEILAGIRQGLLDVKKARHSRNKQKTLQEVINEL